LNDIGLSTRGALKSNPSAIEFVESIVGDCEAFNESPGSEQYNLKRSELEAHQIIFFKVSNPARHEPLLLGTAYCNNRENGRISHAGGGRNVLECKMSS
jgi:hypothetical protein